MSKTFTTVAGLALAAALLQPATGSAHDGHPSPMTPLQKQLAGVHAATRPYLDPKAALSAGYAPFADQNGIYCIGHATEGVMGIHYVHGGRVGDTVLDPAQPEALIYEPQADGSLRLVGMEYIVFQAAWDAVNKRPPELFGQRFHATPEGNRYGIPAFYALHLWLWQYNPAGTFEDWNPLVQCR